MKIGRPPPKGYLEIFVPTTNFKIRFLILSFPLQRYIYRNIRGITIVESHDFQFESMGTRIDFSYSAIHESPSMLIQFLNYPSNNEYNLIDIIQYCSSSITNGDELCSTHHGIYSSNLSTKFPSHAFLNSFSSYKCSLS